MANGIDLQKFCSTDHERRLHKPWSRGSFTYATNGHVAIRIPRQEDVAEDAKAPDIQHLFAMFLDTDPMPFSLGDYQPPTRRCSDCNGTGKRHCRCPDCKCPCEVCSGTGKLPHQSFSVGVRGAAIDGKYATLIDKLPSVKFCEPIGEGAAVPFVFDGGDGLVMPLRGTFSTHVELSKATTPTLPSTGK